MFVARPFVSQVCSVMPSSPGGCCVLSEFVAQLSDPKLKDLIKWTELCPK